MSAQIVTVSPDLIWAPEGVQRLWFFPDGSEHLRYSPHFHMIFESGFRQNLPLQHWASPTFVVVMDGKLSVKNFYGRTLKRILVKDQVWFDRGSGRRAQGVYAMMVPGKKAYARSGR